MKRRAAEEPADAVEVVGQLPVAVGPLGDGVVAAAGVEGGPGGAGDGEGDQDAGVGEGRHGVVPERRGQLGEVLADAAPRVVGIGRPDPPPPGRHVRRVAV